ncbi:MAG: substrate-binding domain-containing protein [Paraprevotella sp.]|nr:substrate-binding domain-containing protein [Paraprevotella sp.]
MDSNIPEISPLAFFGQDSLRSGYFSGRIFMMQAGNSAHRILIMKLMSKGRVASRQQENREVGFRNYMSEHYPACEVIELALQIDEEESHEKQIHAFLTRYPDVRNCITFCSRAYILGEYFLDHGLKDFHLFGYDMVERNIECFKRGGIDFLIAQHPWKQGYDSIKALFNHVVLKKEVQQYNYMSLELLTAENYIYYSADEK